MFFDHGGEEFVFILSGKVIFQVGDERWTLEEGDSIYFDAAIPAPRLEHRPRRPGAGGGPRSGARAAAPRPRVAKTRKGRA